MTWELGSTARRAAAVATFASLTLIAAVAWAPVRAQASPPTIQAPDVITTTEGVPISFEVTVTPWATCGYGFWAYTNIPLPNTAPPPSSTPCDAFNPRKPACSATTTTTYTFTWTPDCDDAGETEIVLVAYNTRTRTSTDNCSIFDVASHVVRIVVADACGQEQFGSISGHVTADCPALSTPLYGVHVDALEVGTGVLGGSAVTDADGSYSIPDLPVGSYTTIVSVPLGYSGMSEGSVEVLADQNAVSDFGLQCQTIPSEPRTIGFWKHQFAVATTGRGSAQVDAATLCSYLDLIEGHFNSNAVNQVVIYPPPASGVCADKLIVGKMLLNLQGSVEMIDRARQQLFALLLNAASGKIGVMSLASADGATVSQAITYCDNLIDDPAGDHEKAKTIADILNNGGTVPDGMIPLETANIAYRRAILEFAAGPSPATGARAFRFAMARPGRVSLAVYDVSGRRVAQVFDGELGAGQHTLRWNGKTSTGMKPSAGVYFAKMSTGAEARILKIVEMSQ